MGVKMNNSEMLNLIVDSTQEAIVVCDQNELVIYWNKAAKNMFGYNFEEIENEKLKKFLNIEMLEDKCNDNSFYVVAKKKTGKTFPIEMSFSTANANYLIILIKDITVEKKRENEINYRKNLENLINRISTNLINVEIDRIKEKITSQLEEISIFFSSEDIYFYLVDDKNDRLYLESGSTGNVLIKLELLKIRNIIDNKDLKSVEEEIFLREINNMYIYILPLKRKLKVVSFLVFTFKEKSEYFDEQITKPLKVLGEILLSSLDRQRIEECLLEGNNDLLEFTAKLKKMHSLSIEAYENQKELLAKTLKKSCEIFQSNYSAFIFDKEIELEIVLTEKNKNYEIKEYKIEKSNKMKIPDEIKKLIKTRTTCTGEMTLEIKEILRLSFLEKIIMTPIFLLDKLYGFLLIGSEKKNKFYTSEEVVLIEMMSKSVERFLVTKKSEEEILKAKEEAEASSKFKSQFLANMSHELRTPMNSIIGFSQMLYEEEENKTKKNTLEIIFKSSKNLLYLINDILDFSKIEAGKVELHEEIFSFRNMLNEIKDLFLTKTKEKNILFKMKIDDRLPSSLIGDDIRIRQVLINLIGNAFKFTTNEGEIRLECSYSDEKKVILKVIDNGVGIPESKKDKIFKVFSQADSSTTRKYGGTGLGLAVSKGFVDLMKGKIFFESLENKGTTFVVELELKEAKNENCLIDEMVMRWCSDLDFKSLVYEVLRTLPEKIKELEEEINNNNKERIEFISHKLAGSTGNLQMMEIYELLRAINDEVRGTNKEKELKKYLEGIKNILKQIPKKYFELKEKRKDWFLEFNTSDLKVLVAEDNEHNQLFIKALLAKIKQGCDLAENGKIALEMLEKEKYDVLFLDMHMPVMDGLETIEKIRSSPDFKDIYVIALTANAVAGDKERYLEKGCDDYISKPIDRDILYSKLLELKNDKKDRKEIGLDGSLEKDFKKYLKDLKNNLQIFESDEIILIGEKLEELSKEFSGINLQLKDIADNFDEERLEEVIKKLEKISF